MKIQAALIEKQGDPFQITELELNDPKQGEVLVKVTACGVCHTDDVARNQIIPVPLPAVFGHEGCGVIEKVGPGVAEFAPGDRVGFSFGSCGVCEACRTGKPYGCRENRRLNFSGVQYDNTKRLLKDDTFVSSFFGQGAFATYAVVHVNNLIPVADDIDLKMVAPMGCGIQTGAGAVLNFLRPGPDSSIIISWNADGDVQAYFAYVENQSGERHELSTGTDTSSTINAASLPAGIYTVYVGALPVNGTESDVQWSSARFGIPSPTAEPTEVPPEEEPTPQPTLAPPTGPISAASSPETIQQLQMRLYSLGLLSVDATAGELDAMTLQAVQEFQTRVNQLYELGLPVIDPTDPDTVIDAATVQAIFMDLSQP